MAERFVTAMGSRKNAARKTAKDFDNPIERENGLIDSDRHKLEMMLCLSVGIIFGCVTQSMFGNRGEWEGTVYAYCADAVKSFFSVAPVTMGFVVLLFICGSFETLRMLIYPAAGLRGMGLGSLICGAMQSGNLRELCFATLVLLPYGVSSCVIGVYAGEYVLGFREVFSGCNERLPDRLVAHELKMLLLYLTLSAVSCGIFAVSCYYFGKNLI